MKTPLVPIKVGPLTLAMLHKGSMTYRPEVRAALHSIAQMLKG